jgi:hypothetical protein
MPASDNSVISRVFSTPPLTHVRRDALACTSALLGTHGNHLLGVHGRYAVVDISFMSSFSLLFLVQPINVTAIDAAPFFYPSNGHYYELITSPLSFTNALSVASQKIYGGLPGYLATVTSQPEYQFLIGVFTDLQDVWIGASESQVEGTFRWMAGPEAGQAMAMTNGMWAPGEPSNGLKEDCVLFWDQKQFNDANCADSYRYLVEYEGVCHFCMNYDPSDKCVHVCLFCMNVCTSVRLTMHLATIANTCILIYNIS